MKCVNPILVWVGGMWTCSTCNSIDCAKEFNKSQSLFGWSIDNQLKIEKKCDCGADKAKTTHAYWCSKYEGN